MVLPDRGVLVIESVDADHVVAVWNPVLIAAFTAAPGAGPLTVIERRAAEAVDSGIPGGLLYVVARRRIVGGIDPSVREMFTRMIRRNEDRAGASAVVLLTEGFAAAIARLAAASLLAVFKGRDKFRVFGTVGDAIHWLSSEHGLSSAEFVQAFEQSTAHLDLGGGQ